MKTFSPEGKLVIFSAPSGSGKTTIVKHLLDQGLQLGFSVSACSREKRAGEVHGRDYFFMSPEEFRERVARGEFVEWEEVYPGRYYGTLRSELERIWRSGKHVVFDVDVMGGLKLKKLFGKAALAIFIQAPSLAELEKRLRSRLTEDPDSLKARLAKAAEELRYAGSFDRILVNDQLTQTLADATGIVRVFLNDEPGNLPR